MPTCIAVRCPHCHSDQIIKHGKTTRGTQRYLCQNQACVTGSFLLDYRGRGCVPEVKQLIIDMSLNASGVRDTARSLHISTDTVLSALKKKEGSLESVNTARLCTLNPEEVTVEIARAGEAEMDEMWSFVRRKNNPRWLWHAIDHRTGEMLAYVFGRRQDVEASDLTDAHQTLGTQDHLLLEIDADARHRHWLVCQPLYLWAGGVKVAISTFRTLPS